MISLQVPLSAKQKEAIKAQLAKESIIRDRLAEVSDVHIIFYISIDWN